VTQKTITTLYTGPSLAVIAHGDTENYHNTATTSATPSLAVTYSNTEKFQNNRPAATTSAVSLHFSLATRPTNVFYMLLLLLN